jgi:hypothetical protein
MLKPKCIDCNKELSTYTAKRCHKCEHKRRILLGLRKGKLHPNYKHGFCCDNKKKYCKCGREMNYRSKHCFNCHLKKFIIHTKQFPSRYWLNKHRDKITKQKISKNSKGKNKGRIPSFSGKRIKYKDICFRSSWEAIYAKYLDKNNIKWLYETKVFDLENTTYRPDFYLPETDEYIEIKGYWYKTSLIKFKLFKKLYPNINIKILMKSQLQKLNLL